MKSWIRQLSLSSKLYNDIRNKGSSDASFLCFCKALQKIFSTYSFHFSKKFYIFAPKYRLIVVIRR